MIAVVFATHREAKPFLSRNHAEPLDDLRLACYQTMPGGSSPVMAVISGMGKVAAAIAALHSVLVYGATTLISAGLCGLLHAGGGNRVGDLFRVRRAVEGDCDRLGENEMSVACDPRWFTAWPAARLVTCDRPVFDARDRQQMSELGDLIDMEGAAIARVAAFSGVACAMIKGVSDTADEDGREMIANAIDRVSGRLAEALLAELSGRSP